MLRSYSILLEIHKVGEPSLTARILHGGGASKNGLCTEWNSSPATLGNLTRIPSSLCTALRQIEGQCEVQNCWDDSKKAVLNKLLDCSCFGKDTCDMMTAAYPSYLFCGRLWAKNWSKTQNSSGRIIFETSCCLSVADSQTSNRCK